MNRLFPALAILFLFAGCGENPADTEVAAADPVVTTEELRAPLFDDLGDHGYPISTSNEQAQQYFDQGLKLAYGFNHHEAVRAFKEAARLDPGCAMCYWGRAYALGPNINKAMDDADIADAFTAVQSALEHSGAGTPVEQGLIGALAKRYDAASNADRAGLDLAYANEMRNVAGKFPQDNEVQVLFAESLMDLIPWDYYQADGSPRSETVEVIAALETVLQNNPDHPGAIHFYIHAVEASDTPERAEPYADRLTLLVPGAGHLVHMPSHIYLRVGRYADASLVNELAAEADESYINQCKAQGYYPATYYPHNIHFLWYTTAMEGRREASIAAARKIYGVLPLDQVDEFREVEYFVPIPLLAYARFGEWNSILDEAAPPARWPYASAMWHYTRGLAYVARAEYKAAKAELAAMEGILAGDLIDSTEIPFILGRSNTKIARDELEGRILLASGYRDDGIALLRSAIVREDVLPYVEPPYWYYPIRQRLGAALMDAKNFTEAETVFRDDLEKNQNNGWSLFGLSQSLRAQGREAEAGEVAAEFEKVWRKADTTLTRSVIE